MISPYLLRWLLLECACLQAEVDKGLGNATARLKLLRHVLFILGVILISHQNLIFFVDIFVLKTSSWSNRSNRCTHPLTWKLLHFYSNAFLAPAQTMYLIKRTQILSANALDQYVSPLNQCWKTLFAFYINAFFAQFLKYIFYILDILHILCRRIFPPVVQLI